MSAGIKDCREGADSEFRDLAALYVLGVLSAEEVRRFEQHAAVCEACADESRAMAEVSVLCAQSLTDGHPPAGLRERVLNAAIQPSAAAALVRSEEGEWQATPFPGVHTKVLFNNAATGDVTSLIRVDPGGWYPSHRHAGVEQCYVLSGDVVFEDHTLHAGDYEATIPSSIHSPVRSVNGCMLLIVNNERDEILMDA